MIGAILEQAFAVRIEGDTVVAAFQEGMAPLVRPLEQKESLQLLSTHATEILGRPMKVRVDVGEGTQATAPAARPERPDRQELTETPAPVPEPRTAARPASPPARSAPPRTAVPGGDLLDRATSEPGVKRLIREFGGQVVEIKPDEKDP